MSETTAMLEFTGDKERKVLYGRSRSKNLFGHVTPKQVSHLARTMIDHANLGMANLGITQDTDAKTVEELIDFVYAAVLREGQKEIESFKTKGARSLQDSLDREYYPKYLAEYRPQIVELVNFLISKLDSPESNSNKSLAKWTEELAGKWKPLATRPNPPLMTITPREAEVHCCQVMLFYGAEGAQVTQYSQDGGIDVVAKNFIAQVKHQEAPVGVKVVRETFGVAEQEGKVGIVFGKNGFTNDGITFATQNGILLISYGREIESWTVATNKALTQGLTSVLPNAKSNAHNIESETAIGWKTMFIGVGRDKIL